ncbi:MAG: Long-chain-fatty-acid--CoA ligase [Actinobacteria bacterium ADurb.Bin444]|nr:MAG: Long-chain-fatty-acid--CoA ligase [Actinobacteria bacterium ADurb.Bin444]
MDLLSYEHCPSDLHFLGDTIGACLRRIAREQGEKEAMVAVHQEKRLSYLQLDAEVDAVAKALLALGVETGDRVAVWSPNYWEWVVVQYATARIGVVLVTINPAYRPQELAFVLKDSRTRVLFLAEAYKGSDYLAMMRQVCPQIEDAAGRAHRAVGSAEFPHLRQAVVLGYGSYGGMFNFAEFKEEGAGVSDSELATREAVLGCDDDINIQYTSGTTGLPKGVTLTHHNILNNAYLVARTLGVTAEDRVCVPLPFYHCFGMVLTNLLAMCMGATLVLSSATFDAEATLTAVSEEQCTVLHGVPTMFIAELEHPRFAEFDLSSLRTGIMAGAPCPVDLMRAVIERMNMTDMQIGYGLTEASPLCTLTSSLDSVERRVTTIGRVLPHQEVKIVDPATGRTLPRGSQGELCVRGYHVMVRYDNRPEATAEAIDEKRWLHTGDLAMMDEQGYVSITGRLKDVVIRGGENLYPREIEEFIHGLPMVSDVYVVGVPDRKMGEEVLAFVKLREGHAAPTPEEFRALCRGHIAHYKIPRYWLVVDEFPMTVTGKVQKFKLREQGMQELGLA